MKNPITKISLVFLSVIVIPSIIYTFIQVSTLNDSERVMEEIYDSQLESILFSINQYSDDLVQSWRLNLNEILSDLDRGEITINQDRVLDFTDLNNSIVSINYFMGLNSNAIQVFNKEKKGKSLPHETLLANSIIINRLLNYSKRNYSKIESLNPSDSPEYSYLVYISPGGGIILIGIDVNKFINNVLSKRMTALASDKFIITIFDKVKEEIIYSTENIYKYEDMIEQKEESKDIWLLKNKKIAIKLKGSSIEDLVRERTFSNMLLLIVMNVIIVMGGIFLFVNFRKEIKLAQLKSEFVANVSHELRTPLSLINMFAETLEMGRVKNDEKRQEYYRIINHETQRLSGLVNRILNFSQIEAGKRKYNFEKIELNNLLNEICENYQFHLENRGFKFECTISQDEKLINGDKEAITEVMINLIDNAVKYSRDIKDIKIETYRENNDAVLSVSDKGIGISKEDQKKIFEKFFRAAHGDVHEVKGTGLGLSIVKHIVDNHHGKINLESNEGSGTKIKILLPLNKE